MTPIVAAVIAAFAAVLVALLTSFTQRVRNELDACLRERRQLKQVLQLVVGSIVGLLAEPQRLELLRAVDKALDDDEHEAA